MLTASHHLNGFHCVCEVPISSTLCILEHFDYESGTIHLTALVWIHCTYSRTQNIEHLTQKYVIPDTHEVSTGEEHARMEAKGREGLCLLTGWLTYGCWCFPLNWGNRGGQRR